MSLLGKILGRRLASWEAAKQKLSVLTGVPVLGLDALASTGYGPEAALTILLPLGVMGLSYFPFIILAIVVNLGALYLSYRQTIAAYPDGGGAYIVAKENLGIHAGLLAGVALLLDYLLNVAVGIAAGVGAVVSAIPELHPYTLPICLIVLLTLTIINLRGVRESGLAFVVPVLVFLGCMAAVILIGLLRVWLSGGHPNPVVPLPAIPPRTATVSAWLLLGAFANGCTAMTGVEAVSNGVPLFREPTVPNAQRTLTVIVAVLSLFLLGVAYLCLVYHIGAMDEQQPGYQTILSQLVAAVAGHGRVLLRRHRQYFHRPHVLGANQLYRFPTCVPVACRGWFFAARLLRSRPAARFFARHYRPGRPFRPDPDCLRRRDRQADPLICGWSV